MTTKIKSVPNLFFLLFFELDVFSLSSEFWVRGGAPPVVVRNLLCVNERRVVLSPVVPSKHRTGVQNPPQAKNPATVRILKIIIKKTARVLMDPSQSGCLQ